MPNLDDFHAYKSTSSGGHVRKWIWMFARNNIYNYCDYFLDFER